MKLSENEVKHIADLSKLGLDGFEVAKFQDELSHILDHYGKEIQSVNTAKVNSNLIIDDGLCLRPDMVEQFSDTKKLVELAPNQKDDLIKVPGVFE